MYDLSPEDIDLLYTQHMRVQSKCVVEYVIYSEGHSLTIEEFEKADKIKRGNRVSINGMQFTMK